MKSLEVRLAEALTALKKVSASKHDKVFDECRKLTTLEAKVNCAEAALKGVQESAPNTFSGKLGSTIEELNEAMREYAVLFDKTPTNNEGAAPITKHNGAIENFVESSPFNGDRSKGATITETDKTTQRKEKLVESLVKSGQCKDEEAARIFLGMKPKVPAGLTRLQEAEFLGARRLGLNAADAERLAKLPLHKKASR